MAALEPSDLQDNATAYAAQLTGDAQTTLAQFGNVSRPLTFNASQPGLCYAVGLLVKVGPTWSKAVRTVAVLTSKKLLPASGPGPELRVLCVPPLQNLCPSARYASWTTRSPQRPEWCLTWSLPLEPSSAGLTSPTRKVKNEGPCSTKVRRFKRFCQRTSRGSTQTGSKSTGTSPEREVTNSISVHIHQATLSSSRISISFLIFVSHLYRQTWTLLFQTSTRGGRCSSTGCRGCVTATSPSSWCRRPGCSRLRWSHTATSHTHL